jgi:hypothetical protein
VCVRTRVGGCVCVLFATQQSPHTWHHTHTHTKMAPERRTQTLSILSLSRSLSLSLDNFLPFSLSLGSLCLLGEGGGVHCFARVCDDELCMWHACALRVNVCVIMCAIVVMVCHCVVKFVTLCVDLECRGVPWRNLCGVHGVRSPKGSIVCPGVPLRGGSIATALSA